MTTNAVEVTGVLIAAATLAVVVYEAGRGWKARHDSKRPPFCHRCGLSNHAPAEQRRLACPRNPDGVGHQWSPG